MRMRSIIGLGVVAAAALLLTACNPIANQPTAVRAGGVSRSGYITYTGSASGWLEVEVRSSADPAVDVLVAGRDETRPIDAHDSNWCYFSTAPAPAWSSGSSLGYQRLAHIGPGTQLKLQFSAPTAGTTFDARVVDDAGVVVGDLTHQVPDPNFDDVAGAICPG